MTTPSHPGKSPHRDPVVWAFLALAATTCFLCIVMAIEINGFDNQLRAVREQNQTLLDGRARLRESHEQIKASLRRLEDAMKK